MPFGPQGFLNTAVMMKQILTRKEFATLVMFTAVGPTVCESMSDKVKIALLQYLARTCLGTVPFLISTRDWADVRACARAQADAGMFAPLK